MSVNVSNGCTSSDQRLFQSHSPDSPLEERSDGDLDCDLFFFLWYSSSSDSEPWKHKGVHTLTTRIAEQSYTTRGGFFHIRLLSTNRSRARSLPVMFLGFFWVLLCLWVVMLAFMLQQDENKDCYTSPLSPRLKIMFPLWIQTNL